MDQWTEGIVSILARAPAGALTLSRILEKLRAEGMPVDGRQKWLLRRLSEQGGEFRVIPDRGCPRITWPAHRGPRTGEYRMLPSPDPWVLSRAAWPCRSGNRSLHRLRETLLAWGVPSTTDRRSRSPGGFGPAGKQSGYPDGSRSPELIRPEAPCPPLPFQVLRHLPEQA